MTGLFIALGLFACDKTRPPPPLEGTEVVSLRVEPQEITVVTGEDGSEQVSFVAIGIDEDMAEEELDTVEWYLSNRSAGEIDENGVVTPATANGGVTWVVARLAGLEAYATLTVLYEDSFNEEGVDTTPFTSGGSVTEQEFWLYPEDGVSLPRNTPAIRFNWQALEDWGPDGAQAYRLRFRSTVTDISVYTTSTEWTVGPNRSTQATSRTDAVTTTAAHVAWVRFGMEDCGPGWLVTSTVAPVLAPVPMNLIQPTVRRRRC